MTKKRKSGKSKKAPPARKIPGADGIERPVKQPAKHGKAPRRKWLTPVSIAIGVFAVLLLLFVFGRQWWKGAGKQKDSGIADTSGFPSYEEPGSDGSVRFSDFLGSEACAECHAKEYDLWKKSTHGRAGGPPSPGVVIGPFDGLERSFQDAVVQPARGNAGEYVFRFRPQALPAADYQVDAVVGGGHMVGGGTQTYFGEFPDGTLRFLPFDFIRKERLWFGETKHAKGWIPISRNLSMTELSEWPPSRALGAHPTMENCQNCHGSQILLEFDAEEKRYHTRYTSLSINCESCHGPGKRHVDLARSGKIGSSPDIGMRSLATLSKDESLEVCFQCHALKDMLQPDYLPGKDLQDHYALKFPVLGENPYHPDGRIRAFGYQQNHLFSDCYLNGSMTCVDCHDPHSQSYRDITGKALADRFDDGQCTSCHASKGLKPEEHSHHPKGSPGNKCVSCHMPYLQHQAMGNQLQFARSDHTIPIPRPAYDNQLGIENACSKCHRDKSIDWLQAKVTEWYGEIKPHNPAVAEWHKAAKEMDRLSAGQFLLNGPATHYMGQMAGLSRFALDYLSPDMETLEPELVERIKRFCESPDLDVRSLALASLHLAMDQKPEIHAYLVKKLKELTAGETAVRRRWALALPYLGKKFEEKGDLNSAIRAYQKALEIRPRHAAIWTNLGLAYQAKGDLDNAIGHYRKALEIDPNDAMSWVNLGNAQENKGDIVSAVSSYEKAIEVNPWNPVAYFNLGNHFYRNEDMASAATWYQKAIDLNPGLALGYFYLTRTYIKAKEYTKALTAVKGGLQLEPANAMGQEMLQALERYFSMGQGS